MKTLLFLILAGFITTAQAQSAKSTGSKGTNTNYEFYVVKDGETEEDIAKKFGITVADLEKWNNLDAPVEEGRILSIDKKYIKKTENTPAAENKEPVEEKPTAKPVTEKKTDAKPVNTNTNDSSYHIVQPNETLYHISKTYNMTVQQLMDLNHLNSLTITTGQKLKVKK